MEIIDGLIYLIIRLSVMVYFGAVVVFVLTSLVSLVRGRQWDWMRLIYMVVVFVIAGIAIENVPVKLLESSKLMLIEAKPIMNELVNELSNIAIDETYIGFEKKLQKDTGAPSIPTYAPTPVPTETPTPEPAQVSPVATPTPASSGLQHTVAYGETLYAISRKYSVDVQALIQLNNISNPNSIRAGQVLQIP